MKRLYRSESGKQAILSQYEQFLSYWPSPSAFRTIPTEFGETFVIQSGSGGKPVMLLHGSASNAAMWMGDAAVLGQKHTVFAVDIVGEPGKSAEARPPMKGGCYARWIRQLMDGLGLDQATIIGNSLGGWLALDFATRFPDRVSALILLASAGLYPFRRTFAVKLLASLIMSKDKAEKAVMGNVEIPDDVLAFISLIQREFIPRPLHAPVFSGKELERLSMPVLYAGGDKDSLLNTQKSAARLKRFVPQADTRILKDATHVVINMGAEICVFLDAAEV